MEFLVFPLSYGIHWPPLPARKQALQQFWIALNTAYKQSNEIYLDTHSPNYLFHRIYPIVVHYLDIKSVALKIE